MKPLGLMVEAETKLRFLRRLYIASLYTGYVAAFEIGWFIKAPLRTVE